MREELLKILPTVRKPSRYLGGEKNSVKKNWEEVSLKVVLSYPDLYEVGMSHLGLQILYHLLNDQPDIACERAFPPWPDMEHALRVSGLPLTSLESGRSLSDFDIVGITLPYELTYTNLLTLLHLSKIPFYASERDESFPLVIGGGSNAFNPEPVADLFDAILIGDGEEAVLEICEVVKNWKGRGAASSTPTKIPLLQRLARIRGIYVPSFFRPHYKSDGTIEKIEPRLEGYEGVSKRIVSDLEKAYVPMKPILPHTRIIHDRVGVEVQRGCTRGCRFCQAGTVSRPERQRSPERVKEIVRNQVKATGQEEVSLVSLSIGDYDCVSPLLKELMDEHGEKNVGIALPATRVEQLTPAMMEEIRRVRKTGFTLAPEAATERMRRVINKGNSEENLLQTVEEVFRQGWRLIKFYFMVGLPTETEEEVTAIARLGEKVLRLGEKYHRKFEINLGISPFVPKPFTPFQWESQLSLEATREKLALLRKNLKSRKLQLKPHSPEMSYLEGVFSRGDRRLTPLLIRAWEKGCRFDEWGEGLRFDLWQESFADCGIDPSFYVERQRAADEILPWDHLFTDIKKEWLWKEYEASLVAAFTSDCSTAECTHCGVCNFKEVRNRAYELPVFDEEGKLVKKKTTTEIRRITGPVPSENFLSPLTALRAPKSFPRTTRDPKIYTYHATFSKKGPLALLSHLELVDHIRRAVSRARLPVRFTEGFHPMPKISFGNGIAVGREVEAEPLSIELSQELEAEMIQKRLNDELPEGIEIKSVLKSSSSPPPLPVAAHTG